MVLEMQWEHTGVPEYLGVQEKPNPDGREIG